MESVGACERANQPLLAAARARAPALVALLSGALALALPSTCAAGADDILGTWSAGNGTVRVKIERCGDAYCGAIAWMRQPSYPPGSQDGPPGEPKRDARNPDSALSTRPLLGLRILERFSYRSEEATWAGGNLYDPEEGKTYRGRIRVLDRDRLELRGYVGIPLFGRTVVWTRAEVEERPGLPGAGPKGPG
jgi:uncharacterized protein (DUF2147 family)